MANILQNFEIALITYQDVREAHPSWSDIAIEDYQARYRDFVQVAEQSDDTLEDVDTGTATEARLRALVFRLDERITDLEQRSADSSINHKFAIINKRINNLIDTLIEEIRALRNDERDKQVVLALCDQINELRLQNAILEEAFETGIVMRDVT